MQCLASPHICPQGSAEEVAAIAAAIKCFERELLDSAPETTDDSDNNWWQRIALLEANGEEADTLPWGVTVSA